MLQPAAREPADRAVLLAEFPDSADFHYGWSAWLTPTAPIAPLMGNRATESCSQRSADRVDLCRNPQRPLSDGENAPPTGAPAAESHPGFRA
jgi:hypothetical protein